MSEHINGCNAYCDPDEGIHATVGYGGRMRLGIPCSAELHGRRGMAKVLVFEEAVEVPPPEDPVLKLEHDSDTGGPWLVLIQFPKPGT